jgi:hypothetical protein
MLIGLETALLDLRGAVTSNFIRVFAVTRFLPFRAK